VNKDYPVVVVNRYLSGYASLVHFGKVRAGLDRNEREARKERQEADRLAKSGQFEAALPHYTRALELNPHDLFALADRGWALANLGRHQEALENFTRFLEFKPNDAFILANRGNILSQLNRYEEALKDFDRSLELRPDEPTTLSNRGFNLIQLKRYEEALRDCNRSLELRPNQLTTLNNRGLALLNLGCYEEALKDFNLSLELRPDNPFILACRGLVLLRLNRYEEALRDYNLSLKFNPDAPSILASRGLVLLKLNRCEEALKDFNRALELNPDDSNSLANRGATLQNLKRYEEALKDFNLALKHGTDDPNILTDRGTTLLNLGRYEEALEDFNRSIELHPDDPETLNNRGWDLGRLGRNEEALKDFSRALELRPDAPNILANRGTTLLNLGRYDEALRDYNHSLELRPDDPDVLANQSITLLNLKRYEEAGKAFDRSLQTRHQKPESMADQNRVDKNILCDRLMNEGIEGRQVDDAFKRVDLLAELAVELERQDCLTCAISWYDVLEKKGIHGELAVHFDASRANAIAGNRYGTKWQWDQPTLAREVFYLRRAVSNPYFKRVSTVEQCKILNNIGNRMQVAGRVIEAIEYWRRALEVLPNFGMALCNQARILTSYAQALEDEGHRTLFLFVAHKEASAALSSTAIYTHPHDQHNREEARQLKEKIESIMDVKAMAALDPLTSPDISQSKEEHDYRNWCLTNRLYLNPLNDLGSYTVATTDLLSLASHVVRVDAPHTFESFFDQMKQEYVSARWMLYEGLTSKVPHFSDKEVLLNLTVPRPALSLAIEKVKAAYRISYSLFDKIGFSLNAYMNLGIPKTQVSFRGVWRPDDKKPIRNEFDQEGNWGFCALYWLAKDFFEKEADEVAEPEARGLRDIRNYLEHKYLRITTDEPETTPPDDLALMVSRNEFESKALHLLKLARSALIYLSIGVGFEEKRRGPSRAGSPIEELPPTPHLSDAEKI
jgi:tetratricopeptide (TPR) repeat protein